LSGRTGVGALSRCRDDSRGSEVVSSGGDAEGGGAIAHDGAVGSACFGEPTEGTEGSVSADGGAGSGDGGASDFGCSGISICHFSPASQTEVILLSHISHSVKKFISVCPLPLRPADAWLIAAPFSGQFFPARRNDPVLVSLAISYTATAALMCGCGS
jgi:hypothetical protein